MRATREQSKLRRRARDRWRHMLDRCYDPTHPGYHNYGGRGITVCDDWRDSFDAYYAAVGDPPEGMTLDRTDVNGDYEPGNVRWATRLTQTHNRRPVVPWQTQRTHCPQQHPYDEANTYVDPSGHRKCRECRRAGRLVAAVPDSTNAPAGEPPRSP